ncbi:hypothetical protein M433DRAFT_137327 [Acidomyces richmondensis BFW]|nr:hypothetical protein M433DRAFT_137327 [Acidomyces richmondensis BFW]
MSFSLSTLLNPEPAPDAPNSSLPPLTGLVHSPEQQQQAQTTHSPAVASPVDGPVTWPPSPSARRPSSSYSGIELPLPTPSTTARKASSPTLEQYQVASRSPDMRRQSAVLPAQSTFTLPPLQGLAQPGPQIREEKTDVAVDVADVAYAYDESVSRPASDSKATVHQSGAIDTSADAPNPADGPTALSTDIAKQEAVHAGHTTSTPVETRAPSSHAAQTDIKSTSTALPAIKQEQTDPTPSQPHIRESSIPVPSTEKQTPEAPPAAPSRKRPAPSRTKKGTAITTKKAPPAKKRKLDPVPKRSETPASSKPGDVYCICRKPDNGSFMIGCDGACDDWFHGKCVGIAERDKTLIDRYVCPNCTREGRGHTTWKRMCRRAGCRLPARVTAGGKGRTGRSKYCSEECGMMYFRELLARTRGRGEYGERPHRQRKGSIVADEFDDLGARGGILSASEVKSLAHAAQSARKFQRLGEESVLSPPATPPLAATAGDTTTATTTKEAFPLAPEDVRELEAILLKKDEARRRHAALKERMRFVETVKSAAAAAAEERGLKAKEFCGYDSRLENGEFDGEGEVCERKKCARHLEWAKLAVDSVRAEMAENSDRMRGLEKEERAVKGRGAWRASLKEADWRGSGWVEVHIHPAEGGDSQS